MLKLRRASTKDLWASSHLPALWPPKPLSSPMKHAGVAHALPVYIHGYLALCADHGLPILKSRLAHTRGQAGSRAHLLGEELLLVLAVLGREVSVEARIDVDDGVVVVVVFVVDVTWPVIGHGLEELGLRHELWGGHHIGVHGHLRVWSAYHAWRRREGAHVRDHHGRGVEVVAAVARGAAGEGVEGAGALLFHGVEALVVGLVGVARGPLDDAAVVFGFDREVW